MIIDVRGILNRIDEEKREDNNYFLDMEYVNGDFVPKLSNGQPKINIPAKDSTRELVGLAIAVNGIKPYTMTVLTNNGLFIDNGKFMSCADVLLLPSYHDARRFIELLNSGEYVQTIQPPKTYLIYAVYQEFGDRHLSFKVI